MTRRTKIHKWLFVIAFLGLNCGLMTASRASATPDVIPKYFIGNADDTLRDRAMIILKQHMDDLRELSSRQFAFRSGYVTPNPTVPCDYCVQAKDTKLDEYIVDVSNRFENFDFTYEITDAYDEMLVITNQKGDYEVYINVKKTVRGLLENDNTINAKKHKTTFLVYRFKLDYIQGVYGILEITAEQAPGADIWMIELNPNLGVSSPDFGNQEIYAASSSSALLTKLGVVRYFNPFGGVNGANIWFKAGARINLLNSRLNSDILDFTSPEVGLVGGDETNPHEIDIMRSLTDVVEQKTSVLLEIPIGFSKRFRLSNSTELSLEAEVSYSLHLITRYKTTYFLDQLGVNHLLNNDIQSQSGGEPVLYESNPAAVMNTDGEIIDFFRNKSEEMKPENLSNNGFLTFSFRPSLMISKYESIKYNIGLNLGFSPINSDPFPINYSYFNSGNSESVRPIHEANEASSMIFAGIIFWS